MNIEQLTLEEKIGQMLCFAFEGTTFNDQLKKLIVEHKLGSIIHFARNIESVEQIKRLNQEIQAHSPKIPVFIGLDQEGGMVRRVTEKITYLPGAMSMAATQANHLYELNYSMGRDLKALGFHVNYAPVADVNNNPNNPVINSRSFGDDPRKVSDCVVKAFQGSQDALVLPTVKHFPGHGDTAVDSHLGLPVVEKSLTELENLELIPFQEAINKGIDGVMVGHILFPQIDEALPSSLSYNIITKLLKEKMGFRGLITTDSLTMAAIWKRYSIEEIVLHGVNAGNDILVFCGPALLSMQEEIIAAFKKLIGEKKISMERIDESVAKVLALKQKYAISENIEINANEMSKVVVRESITKVKDHGLLPLKKEDRVLILFPKIHLASLVDNDNNTYETLKKHLNYEEIIVGEDEGILDLVVAKQEKYDKIIVATYNVKEGDLQDRLLQRLDAMKVIVVALRSPYDIRVLKTAKTYICTYDVTKESIEALSQALLSNEFYGTLPITLEEERKMKVIKVKNYEELSKVAAQYFIDLVNKKPNAVLGLATGSSPIGLYKELIAAYEQGLVRFKDVTSFNLDEYCGLPQNHPETYYNFMHRNLFDHIDIQEKNVHLPSAKMDALQEACDEYNNLLSKHTIDLQLLGIGSNGHIGFNEPGTSFESYTQVIKLAEKTRQDNKRFFNSIDEVPTHAITMGIKTIMSSKMVVLVATGKGKADAINKLINGPVTEDFPASILQRHDNVVVIVDEDAASLL